MKWIGLIEPGGQLPKSNDHEWISSVEEVWWIVMRNNTGYVVEIIRLRLAGGEPIAFRQPILPMNLFPERAPTDSYQSRFLKIGGSALLYLNKIFHSNAHAPPQRDI